jgi:Ca2+-transporting ATPase
VLSSVSSIASGNAQSVLTVVQLLWLNLVQDTFAALALATDPPTLELLHRKPEFRNTSIITVNMWKMIIGQALLQLLVTFVLKFAGHRIFPGWTALELNTVVFNTYSWLQISNQINCRRIDNKLNVFSGIHRNWLFIAITLITIGGQILIINVGGMAFSVTRLNGVQWAVSIILGLLSLPFGVVVRLIPIKPMKSFGSSWRRRRSNQSRIEDGILLPEGRSSAAESTVQITQEIPDGIKLRPAADT